MKRLTAEHIIMMHRKMISETGGSPDLRVMGLLESAVNAPFQTFAGEELYPTLTGKAARLGYSIINNHPFVDGNKRIGVHSMLVFLALNGIELCYTDDELTNEILETASGNITEEGFLNWITAHLQGKQ